MEAKKTLRIVGGMHEGARLNLAPGDYVIGSAEDCDIVLRDASVAPRHVRLTVGRSKQVSLPNWTRPHKLPAKK